MPEPANKAQAVFHRGAGCMRVLRAANAHNALVQAEIPIGAIHSDSACLAAARGAPKDDIQQLRPACNNKINC